MQRSLTDQSKESKTPKTIEGAFQMMTSRRIRRSKKTFRKAPSTFDSFDFQTPEVPSTAEPFDSFD